MHAGARVAALFLTCLALGGCAATATGSSRRATATIASARAGGGAGSAGTACSAVVDATLLSVAQRIYAQAAGGRNVASVERRFARSRALGRAVAVGNRAATRAALAPLLKAQVKRLVVWRGSRELARLGHTAALAPVTATIHDAGGTPVGHYRFAVAGDAGIAGLIHTLTGAGVSMTAAGHPVAHVAGATGPARSFVATAFPQGALRVRLAMATPAALTCAPSADQTRARAIGAVGERLYQAEASGRATQRVLRHVARDARFLHTVAHADARALRAEIVHLFRGRTLHVVRIRAVTATGRLVNDVGGPYVLAPASTPLRLGGRAIGRATLSIQDDTGFVKLMQRFTGAVIELRTPAGRVPGGNVPAPGRAYWRAGFDARAFPAGPLRVTELILRRGRGSGRRR
ncbi:MAG: hypothetical protein ABI950_04525 [Solirubrobacteraceae bacterium]